MPDYETKFVVLCYNWCSYGDADLAGVSRMQMPPGFRIIRVMCSSGVRPEWVIKA